MVIKQTHSVKDGGIPDEREGKCYIRGEAKKERKKERKKEEKRTSLTSKTSPSVSFEMWICKLQ